MVKTRQHLQNLSGKREKRREERESIPLSVRTERLSITKAIANEIVRTQDELGGSSFGCRMKIIRRYNQIYSWLNKQQVDWHIKQIRKRNNSNANSSKYSANSNVIDNLNVNDSTITIEEKDTSSSITVSLDIVRLIVGGEGTPILGVPRPRRITHLGLAASCLQINGTSHSVWPRWHYPSGPRN